MNNDDRKLTRLVIRQVHPDLFNNNPYERHCNSESLKAFNSYINELGKGRTPRPTRLEFFVREGSLLRKVEVQLSSSGSLAPLFYAFGFITTDQLHARDTVSSADDTDFLGWLREQVQDAVRTAEKHDVLKWHIRRLKTSLEERFQLAAVQVGAEYAVSLAEQERQVESLKVLEGALSAVAKEKNEALYFEGLTMQLYHPRACPQESRSYVDERGNYIMKMTHMQSYIGDDGTVHLVTDRNTIRDQLRTIDMGRARMLTQVSFFWLKRVRDLAPVVQDMLGVRSVWCDTKSEHNSQKFVLWAGYLLEQREQIVKRLNNRKFSFSIIVHADSYVPLINFHQSSPILNVSSDCPPDHLLEFLVSEGGLQASEAADEVQSQRAKEEALLERVRQVFEAKCVIKICMNDKVIEGAMRLLDHADTIKQAVDLKGACIALDDCYEVWDSGFISIPYNFKIQELSNMVKMLQSGQRPEAGSDTAAASSNGTSSKASKVASSSRSTSSKASSNGASKPGAAKTGASVEGAASGAPGSSSGVNASAQGGSSPSRQTVAASCMPHVRLHRLHDHLPARPSTQLFRAVQLVRPGLVRGKHSACPTPVRRM